MRMTALRPILVNLLVAVFYAAAGIATLSLGVAAGPDLSTVVWISSGLAFALALQVPFPVWPGAALGAIATTLFEGSPWLHVAATGVANGGEIALGVFLLGKVGFNRRFGAVRDVVYFVVLACGVACATAALLSVVSLVATGGAPEAAFGRIWLMWWLTHGMGMLVVVPLALIVRARGREVTRAAWREGAVLLSAAFVTSWTSFLAPAGSMRAELFFLPLPILLRSAVRGDALVATLGAFIVTTAAIAGALGLEGPFSQRTANEALFLTWSFASVTIVATVTATAVVRERALAQREVQRGERRLRAVLEATNEGILVADDLGRVTDVNSAFLSLIGGRRVSLRSNEPYAHVDSFLERLRPGGPNGGKGPAALDPDIEAGRQAFAEVRLEDGRVLEAESMPLAGRDDPPGRVWSVRDVTQRVASEEERRRLHEQVLHSQKLEGLGVLAGGVAHDFNNVLAGIMGYAELLLAQPGLDAEGRQDAEGIVRAAQHAAGLCGQLLTYAGRNTAVLAPVDLSACVKDMRQFMAMSVSKNVDLSLDTPSHPVVCIADEVQIRQVIFNLVVNASEAISERPGRGRIGVRVGSRFCDREWLAHAYGADDLQEGTYGIVEVQDDGVGMEPAFVSQIFDPFFSSKGPGRGLGLSAVLGVLRTHRGALAVESDAGTGTRFQIVLPHAQTRHAEAPAASQSIAPSGPRGRATVLVVDDEPVVRQTLSRMIQMDGHAVLEAEHGDHALAILAERHDAIDLIVLDLTMPNRDGLATLAEMKERGYRIPVLLASGYSSGAVPAEAAVAGFIQKPFRASELSERVAEALYPNPSGEAART
jgi:signal transduction histidine kinase/ActR/RegA family two-component response regulator